MSLISEPNDMFNFLEKISLHFMKEKTLIRNVFNNNVGRDQYNQYNGIVVNDPETGKAILNQQRKNAGLSGYGLQFAKSQLEACKEALLQCNFNSFREEVTSIGIGDIDGLPEDEKQVTYYYLCLYGYIESDKEKVDRYFKSLNKSYSTQINAIKMLTEEEGWNPAFFSELYSETQSVILLRLFNSKRYKDIQNLFGQGSTAVNFFKGLSCFNQSEFSQAEELLEKVCAPDNTNVTAFILLANIHKNIQLTYDGENHINEVEEKEKELDQFLAKYPSSLSENQVLLAVTKLQVVLCAKAGDKEAFLTAYNSLDDKIKNSYPIKAIRVDFLQRFGMFREAVELCMDLDWEKNAQIAVFYEHSLLESQKYEEVIDVYNSLDGSLRNMTDGRLESFWLSALAKTDNEKYLNELGCQLVSYPENVAFIISNTSDENTFTKVISPFLEQHFDILANASDSDKGVLISTFIKLKRYDYAIRLINEVRNFKRIPRFATADIYKELFIRAKSFSIGDRKNNLIESDLHKIEAIADKFIEHNVELKYFYQIKVMCCQYLGKNLSAAEYARKLFALAPSPDLAANIVQFLHSLNNHNTSDYQPYIKELKGSTVPSYMMALAFAYLKLGEGEAAESSAYRAIYYLNGREDFNIFNAYLSFAAQMLAGDYERQADDKKVVGNCVITMKSENAGDILTYCLDKEEDLKEDSSNNSLDIQHINKFSSTLYSKFLGGAKGQQYNIDGKSYKLVDITDRYVYTHRYVLNKALNNPDKITVFTQTITGATPKESVEKIKQYMLQHKNNPMLDMYHFKDNEVGVPIDALKSGDADSYLGTVAYLLQKKEEILYTGEITNNVHSDRYVISLASLVVLCLLDQMQVLDEFIGRIYIPDSLIPFIDDRIHSCGTHKVHSGGSIVAKDNDVFLLPDQSDKEIEIWEKIKAYCEKLMTVQLSNEERITFRLADCISAEEAFHAFLALPIELDFFVAVSKISAVYICDDLFFRKMANWTGIPHMNVASLSYDMEDLEKAKVFVEKISEYNYLYAPYLPTDDRAWSNRVLTNLTTKNKYKEQVYRPIISNAIMNAWKEILSELQEAEELPQNINNEKLNDNQKKELEELSRRSEEEIKSEAEKVPDCPPLG